jgi:small subunit ribosomal protein S15
MTGTYQALTTAIHEIEIPWEVKEDCLIALSELYAEHMIDHNLDTDDTETYMNHVNQSVLSDETFLNKLQKGDISSFEIEDIDDSSFKIKYSTSISSEEHRIEINRTFQQKSEIFKCIDSAGVEEEDIEDRIIELHERGYQPSKIGMKLRDGGVDGVPIPDVKFATGKKVSEVIEDRGHRVTVPEDLKSTLKRAIKLNDHMKQHPNDKQNKRQLQIAESDARKLIDYYRGDKIDEDFTYSYRNAKELIGQFDRHQTR